MFRQGDLPPPLSPALLAGLALRPLPPQLLQPVFSHVMHCVSRRYASVFERMASGAVQRFLIDPVDLPFVFDLSIGSDAPKLTVLRDGAGVRATAAVRGPITALLALLEGKIDGDALFFSRVLTIEGDTEAVLALRNAVDGADIDLRRDMLSELGILKAAAEPTLAALERLWSRVDRDMELLSAALLAPVNKRLDQQEVKQRRLSEQVEPRGRTVRKRGEAA